MPIPSQHLRHGIILSVDPSKLCRPIPTMVADLRQSPPSGLIAVGCAVVLWIAGVLVELQYYVVPTQFSWCGIV